MYQLLYMLKLCPVCSKRALELLFIEQIMNFVLISITMLESFTANQEEVGFKDTLFGIY